MATSNQSSGQTLFDLTSFVGATHANPSALLEKGVERTTHATYGHGYATPLANYDPDTQSWKMFGDIFLWEEHQCLVTLPKSGITQNGVLYQQPEWERPIAENGSLLWPTPTTANWVTSTSIETTRDQMLKGEKYSSRIVQAVAIAEPTATGYLNPMWVEWLMGFPLGWTDLEDLETQ
jgi:hypothetical protein